MQGYFEAPEAFKDFMRLLKPPPALVHILDAYDIKFDASSSDWFNVKVSPKEKKNLIV